MPWVKQNFLEEPQKYRDGSDGCCEWADEFHTTAEVPRTYSPKQKQDDVKNELGLGIK